MGKQSIQPPSDDLAAQFLKQQQSAIQPPSDDLASKFLAAQKKNPNEKLNATELSGAKPSSDGKEEEGWFTSALMLVPRLAKGIAEGYQNANIDTGIEMARELTVNLMPDKFFAPKKMSFEEKLKAYDSSFAPMIEKQKTAIKGSANIVDEGGFRLPDAEALGAALGGQLLQMQRNTNIGGMVLNHLSATESNYEEARQRGIDPQKAYLMSHALGLTETLIDKYSGIDGRVEKFVAGKLGKAASDEAIDQIVKLGIKSDAFDEAVKTSGGFLKNLLTKGAIPEFISEGIQQVVTTGEKQLFDTYQKATNQVNEGDKDKKGQYGVDILSMETARDVVNSSFMGGLVGSLGYSFTASGDFNPTVYATLQREYNEKGKDGLGAAIENVKSGITKASESGKLTPEQYNTALQNVDKIANNVSTFEQNSKIDPYTRFKLFDLNERLIPMASNGIAKDLAKMATPVEMPTSQQIDDDLANGNVTAVSFDQLTDVPDSYRSFADVAEDENGNKVLQFEVPNSIVKAHTDNQMAIQTLMNNPLFAIKSLTDNNQVVTVEDLENIGLGGGAVFPSSSQQLQFKTKFEENRAAIINGIKTINYLKSVSNQIKDTGKAPDDGSLNTALNNIYKYNTGDTVFYNNTAHKILETSSDGQKLKLSGIQEQVNASDENLKTQRQAEEDNAAQPVAEQGAEQTQAEPTAPTMEQTTTAAEQPATTNVEEDTVDFPSKTIGDAVYELTPYVYQGRTGRLQQQSNGLVTFETKDKVYELGNIADLKDTPLSEWGIVQQEMSTDKNFGVTIDGKTFTNKNQNPFAAITYDENGEAVSVKLQDDKGKTKTIKGARAQLIDAQYKERKILNESTDEQLNEVEQQVTARTEDIGNAEQAPTGGQVKPVEPAFTEKQRERQRAINEVAKRLAQQSDNMKNTNEAIANITSSLFTAGINVEVLTTEQIKAKYGSGNASAQGFFISEKGVIVINKNMVESEWGKSVVFHEATHPIINIIRNADPKAFKQLIKAIRDMRGDNATIDSIIKSIEAQPDYKGQFTQDDEIVVETIARIASGKLTLKELTPSLSQKIKDLINKIGKVLGFKQVLRDNNDVAFVRLANQISDVLNSGRDIAEIVGAENVTNHSKRGISNRAVEDSEVQQRIIENEDFDEDRSIVDIMNSLGGVNIGVDISNEANQTGKLDVNSIKVGQKGLVIQPEFVKVDDFTGKPILLTISDELTTGSVKNPVTGNEIGSLFGGLNFNYTEGNTEYAWAYTAEENALTMLKQAKQLYAKNPELYPDGIVPVAVVKMGKGAMSSNEAIIRQIIDNLSDKSIPEKNKVNALIALKKDVADVYNKIKESNSKKLKSKDKKPTASEKAAERGFEKIVELVNSSNTFDSLIENITSLNIGTRPLLIDRLTSGKADVVPEANRMSTSLPTLKALFNGMPKSELKRTNLGMIVNLISEKALESVPDKHIISFVGIDVTAEAPIKINTHPNYPYALKGKGLGIVENTRHLASVMPSAYGNILNKVLKNESEGKVDTTKKYITSGLPAGLNNIALRNKSLNTKSTDYNKVLGYLNLSFPSVNFFVDSDSWNSLLADNSVTQYKREGGVIYAATKKGNIYINPEFDSTKTPIHKFGHIWLNAIESQRPELFSKGLSLVEGTEQLAASIKEYGDNLQARKDALSELISNRGESIINAAKKSEFKEWLVSVFKYVQSQFKSLSKLSNKQIEKLSLSDFVDGAVKDILGGKAVSNYAIKSINDSPQMSNIDRDYTPEGTVADAGMTMAERQAWKDKNKVNQKQRRNPIVQQTAKALSEGFTTFEEYVNVVRNNMPINPFKDVPKLPSLKEVVSALDNGKLSRGGIVGVNRSFNDGDKVATRLDIPAYEDYDTWVVSIHDQFKEGKVLAYGQTAVLKNVVFKTSAKGGIGIAIDKDKTTIARMFGDWSNEAPESAHKRATELMNDPAWTQVGMNPFRHSFFYDKSNGEPLLGADEVIQVGALVLAKNVKRAPIGSEAFKNHFTFVNKVGQEIQFSNMSRDDQRINTIRNEYYNNDVPADVLIEAAKKEYGLDQAAAEALVSKATGSVLDLAPYETDSKAELGDEKITPEVQEILDEYTTDYENDKKQKLAKESKKTTFADIAVKLYDSKFKIRRILQSLSDMQTLSSAKLRNIMGKAKASSMEAQQAIARIYGGLSESQIRIFDQLNFALRVIQVDKNNNEKVYKEYDNLRKQFIKENNGKMPNEKQLEDLMAEARNLVPNINHGLLDNTRLYTAADATKFIDKLRNAYSTEDFDNLMSRAAEYKKVGNESVAKMLKAGMISQEVADKYKDDFYTFRKTLERYYDDYSSNVPIYYKDGVAYYSAFKSLGEGSKESYFQRDSRVLLAENILIVNKAIAKNDLRKSIFNDVMINPENFFENNDNVQRVIKTKEGGDLSFAFKPAVYERDKDGKVKKEASGYVVKPAQDGFVNVPFRVDGSLQYLQMEKELYDEVEGLNTAFSPQDSNLVMQAYYGASNVANKVLTASQTRYNPLFFWRNMSMDIRHQVHFTDYWTSDKNFLVSNVYSAYGRLLFKSIANTKKIFANDENMVKLLEEATEVGLFMDTYSEAREQIKRSSEIDTYAVVDGKPSKWDRFKTGVAAMNVKTEIAMRVSAYEQAKKHLTEEYKKLHNVTELNEAQLEEIKEIASAQARGYTDFAQKGTVTPQLNYAYLNASIQGLGSAIEYSYDNPAKTLRKTSELFVGHMIWTTMLMMAIPDLYDELDEYTKDIYMLSPTGFAMKKIKDSLGLPSSFIPASKIDPTLVPIMGVARRTAEHFVKSMRGEKTEPITYEETARLINIALPSIFALPEKTAPLDAIGDWGSKILSGSSLLSGGTKLVFGYDAFRGKDIDSKNPNGGSNSLDGMYDSQIPYIYKVMSKAAALATSEDLKAVSPARINAAAESFIGSPKSSFLTGILTAIASDVANIIIPASDIEKSEITIFNPKTVMKSFGVITDSGMKERVQNRKFMDESHKLNMKAADIETIADKNIDLFYKENPATFMSRVEKYAEQWDYAGDEDATERLLKKAELKLNKLERKSNIPKDLSTEVKIIYYTKGTDNQAKMLKSIAGDDKRMANRIIESLYDFGMDEGKMIEIEDKYYQK